MLNKIIILLAAMLSIAGCSSDAPPPAAERVPGATTALFLPVMADNWVGGVVQVATKNKDRCGQFGANILPDPVDDDYIVEIAGNNDIFFHVFRLDAQTVCDKYGMFYATQGNEYLIKFLIKNNQCEFALLEKSPNGGQKEINTYPAHASKVDGIKVCEKKENLY